MRRTAAALLLLVPACALAQDRLDSAAAQDFRRRVVDLALLYDASSGLDLQGRLVKARAQAPGVDGCRRVDVTTSRDGAVVREDTVRVCGSDHAPRVSPPGG